SLSRKFSWSEGRAPRSKATVARGEMSAQQGGRMCDAAGHSPYDRDDHSPLLPWAIELAEEHVLPGAEAEASVGDGDRLRRAHDRALDMRRGVAVDPVMEPARVERHHPVERRRQILADVGIVVLVDGDRRRRMRREHGALPRLDLGLVERALDL